MSISKIRPKGQITLPADVRTAANLAEGALVEFVVTDEGVLIRPKVAVDAEDAWFWSPEWQSGEREASAQAAAGEGEIHRSDDGLLAVLDANT